MQSAYAKADTGRWIEDTGFVRRLLPDDDDVDRHQRFIIRDKDGRSLLIAHNIDLAPRVPLVEGDRIEFSGTVRPIGRDFTWAGRKADSEED